MKTLLKHIANIQTGVYGKTVSTGEIVYLQAKHFSETGQLNAILHADLKPDNVTERHLLRPGDVLFAAKGTKNFAAVYESKNPSAVASTSFFVIRLAEKNMLPEFVAWFLNHPSTQKLLKGSAIGTAIVSISKAVLENLEIYIPDLQTQKTILKIAGLRNTEKKLVREIEALREKLIQQQIINAIK